MGVASRDVIKRTAVLVSVAIEVQVLHRMDSSNSDSDASTAASVLQVLMLQKVLVSLDCLILCLMLAQKV